MLLLNKKDEVVVRKRLEAMERDVTIRYFSQKDECDYCPENLQLLQLIAALSSKIHIEVYDLHENRRETEIENIVRAPATKLIGEDNQHIVFYGIPSGFEFLSLLEDILMVSKRDSGLGEETRRRLGALREPLHLQVFVTPSCPYCPGTARLAHQFAMENPLVSADVVESVEFPALSDAYDVSTVPLTIVNGVKSVHGALDEGAYLDAILGL